MRTRYLNNTLDITKKISDQASQIFTKYLNISINTVAPIADNKEDQKETQNKAKKQPEPAPSDVKAEKKVNSDDIIEAKKEHKEENLKKVFRKIATLIHPDKTLKLSDFEKSVKTKLFEKARLAFQKNDYYGMVEIAQELGIELPPPSKEQIELMKENNKKLEKQINTIKNSVVWAWYHAEDQSKKQRIMDNYIDYLEKNNSRT